MDTNNLAGLREKLIDKADNIDLQVLNTTATIGSDNNQHGNHHQQQQQQLQRVDSTSMEHQFNHQLIDVMQPERRRLSGKATERWFYSLAGLCALLAIALMFSLVKMRRCCFDDGGGGGGKVPFKCFANVNNGPVGLRNDDVLPINDTADDQTRKITAITVDSDEQKQQHQVANNERSLWNQPRLPPHFVPLTYAIRLRIDVHKRFFTGNSSVRFLCTETLPFIVIHADLNLKFDMANYVPKVNEWSGAANDSDATILNDPTQTTTKTSTKSAAGRSLRIKRMDYNYMFTYYVIELIDGELFQKDHTYVITFENFRSNITNSLKGLYYSTYNEGDETKTLIVSQLQPTDARKVFPSFDEPNLKAVFFISIETHSNFRALSNMEEQSIERLDENWTITKFAPTPRMSTYIIAFVVTEFEPIQSIGPNGLKIRVWVRNEYKDNTIFAIDAIPKAFAFFEEYFNITEVVTKSDHFAAPDFNAGAMENWGLIVYRESALLFDEQKSLLEDEFFVMLVICHEISHSWFGNMATFKWWDNVWLNEAFANTLMYFAMERIRPDFKVLETLVVYDVFNVMEKDSIETTHAISTQIDDPREVQQFFDEISYEKGLAVLRMLRGFIGDDYFRLSLSKHIQTYMLSNCDMEELWAIISKTTNYTYNISNIMTNWITQEGYPVVNVTRTILHNTSTIVYELTQEHFRLSRNSATDKHYKWVIPFTYKLQNTSSLSSQIAWLNLTGNRVQLPLAGDNANKWLLGNINCMGYYRVNYDHENWMRIISQLKVDHSVFSVTERAALIFDSFTLSRAGYVDYLIPLQLSSYLVRETDYVPWKSFFRSITYIDNMLSSSSCYGDFQEHTASQITDIYYKLGWKDKGTYLERLLRSNVIKYAAYYEFDDAVEKSKQTFQLYMNGAVPEKHLVEAVYCTGIKYGSYKTWVDLFNRSINSIPAEQNILWQGLACNRDTWILKSLLELCLQENIIRRQEVRRIYSFFSLTSISRSVYFEFLIKNWEYILERYSSDAFVMSGILETLATGLNDEYSLERVKSLLKKGVGVATNTPSFIINQISSNIEWTNNYEQKICRYLKQLKHGDSVK